MKADIKYYYKYYDNTQIRFAINYREGQEMLDLLIQRGLLEPPTEFNTAYNTFSTRVSDYAIDLIRTNALDEIFPDRVE